MDLGPIYCYVAQSLVGPDAVVGSGRYAVYDYLDVEKRQVCWAHLLRDFTRIAERSGQPRRIGMRLLGLGYVMFRWRERSAKDFEPVQRRVRAALQQGAAQLDCARTAKTCANLLKLWPAMWTFLKHSEVEPTNNAAEQALRSIVLKRKISGPTRSRRGDEFIARGFSVMETCRRQGRDCSTTCTSPWWPGSTRPHRRAWYLPADLPASAWRPAFIPVRRLPLP